MWANSFSIGFLRVIKMEKDTYTLKKTITFSNAVARVFSPIISNEEREKRMKAIHKASSNLMKEVVKNEKVF